MVKQNLFQGWLLLLSRALTGLADCTAGPAGEYEDEDDNKDEDNDDDNMDEDDVDDNTDEDDDDGGVCW